MTVSIYGYYSSLGLLNIRRDKDRADAWYLFMDSNCVSDPITGDALAWPTAEAAADAVAARKTGFAVWDSLPYVVYPVTLDDWRELKHLEDE